MSLTELKFTDVKPEELVGRSVLCSNRNSSKFVDKIVKVTKTGFRISKYPNTLFNFSGSSKSRDVWDTRYCRLLTDEDATVLIKKYNDASEKSKLIKLITSSITECDLCTVSLIHQTIVNHLTNT